MVQMMVSNDQSLQLKDHYEPYVNLKQQYGNKVYGFFRYALNESLLTLSTAPIYCGSFIYNSGSVVKDLALLFSLAWG